MNTWTNRLLWIVYAALLGVLLPHTAWAFGQFEPTGWRWLGWIGAIAFEGAIAALTWRLKQAIEQSANSRRLSIRWRRRYLNTYAAGLIVSIGVSSAANWAHAVEFGKAFTVFARYSVSPLMYSVMFGAILPMCSLLFAHILAGVQESEQETDPALAEANTTIRELRRNLSDTEQRALIAEQRFAAIGDLAIMLTTENRQERILAARRRWPQLPGRSIAIITETAPSYVSEILENSKEAS